MAKKDSGEDLVMGILSYLWILSVIPLLVKKNNKFIYDHAKQGFALFILWVILAILSWILPFFGWLFWLIDLVIVILVIIGIVKVVQGEVWKMPVIYDIVKKY